jgi:hypothetical protein
VKTPGDFHKGRTECKTCVNKKKVLAKLHKRTQDRRTAFATLVAGIRGNKIEVPHTSELAAEMIRLYGGLGRFCKEWKADLDALRTQRPGTKAVIDSKLAIIKLVVESTNQRDSAPDLAGLSDEDLEKELVGVVAVLMAKNPEVLAQILDKPELLEHDGSDAGTEDKDS